jgi:hypothetical protein
MKLELFSRENFEKYSNIKFHENPPSGSRNVPCGQNDGKVDRRTEDEASSCFSQSSNWPKNEAITLSASSNVLKLS